MKEVTNRFIDVYNYLMNNNFITNPSDFSKKIGISTSMMNEILKGRSNAGIKVIQNTVMEFNFINAEYLITGIGEIVKTKSEENLIKKNDNINDKENDKKPNVQKNLSNETNPEVEWLQKDVKILEANLADIRRSEARLVQDNQDLKHNYQELKEELKTTKQELKESLHREMLLKIEVEKLKNVSDLGNTRAEVG